MTPPSPRHRRRLRAATGAALLALMAPAVGFAHPSPTETAPPLRQALPLDAPRDLRVVRSTSTSLTVAWSRPRRAERFRLVRSTSRTMTPVRVTWTSRTRFRLTGLEPGTAYHLRVRVVDGRRALSPFSRRLRASTDQAPAPVGSTDPTDDPTGPTDPGTTTPASPAQRTLFGANYTPNPMVDEGVYGGRATVARVFFQGLGGVRFLNSAAVKEALADGVETFVISWKETDPASIRTFLAGIPEGLTVYTTYHHEPENDHGAPGSAEYRAWSAEYRRQWELQAPLMRAEGFIPTSILMAYTLVASSGRDVADWTPPAGTVDVFAFDAYYGQGKDPSALVTRMAAAAAASGVTRTGLAETGAPTSDNARLSNTVEMRAALLGAGVFEWGVFWNSAEGSYDSRMDAATADAWFGS